MSWFARTILCCHEEEEEPQRPQFTIGTPFDFRREEVSIPAFEQETQQLRGLRNQADQDRLFASLVPIKAPLINSSNDSASTTSSLAPPDTSSTVKSSTKSVNFATPAPLNLAPSGGSPVPPSTPSPRLDRVKMHTRRLSNSILSVATAGKHGSTASGYSNIVNDSPATVSSEFSGRSSNPAQQTTQTQTANVSVQQTPKHTSMDFGNGFDIDFASMQRQQLDPHKTGFETSCAAIAGSEDGNSPRLVSP